MANQQQQQPAHDFAPSWLKIPTYDTTKSSDHSSRSDTHRLPLHQRRSAGSLRSGFQGDGFRDLGGRQQSPPFSVRHASMDAEDRLFHQAGGPSNRAAPPPRRPHSRHDFRDFPPSSHHKMSPNAVVPCGDNCANVVCAQAGPAASQHDKKDLTGNNFNQEFPTLLGADEAPVQQPAVTNGSVWENPRNSRVHGTVLRKGHLVQRPRPDPSAGTLLETRSRSPGSTTGGTGVVTPAAALSPKLGHTTGLTGSAPAASKSSVSASQNSLYRALLPSSNKTVREKGGPLAHAMEVLVKKQPRTKGGNKVDFLKALRSCKDDEEAKGAGGDTAALHDRTNGHIQVDDGQSNVDQGNDLESSACDVGKLTLEAPEHPPLSSSLEAEQRLLREMGWKEDASDDDAYAPLTEDELREFQYITKMRQEKQQQQQRNGNTQRTVTAALSDRASLWSPRRACSQVYTGLVMGNGWSSSSSSDTDSDGD